MILILFITMDVVNYKELQAQRDLQACGLTEESINAIRSTSVVNHQGTQQVVPNSQVGNYEEAQIQDQNAIHIEDTTGEVSQSVIASLQTQLVEQQRMFSRFKQFSDQRITSLERQLASALETIKDMSNRINTIASNSQARAALPPQQSTTVAAVAQAPAEEKKPSTVAIDRNGVAPESVQIDKIFYCGEK